MINQAAYTVKERSVLGLFFLIGSYIERTLYLFNCYNH